MIQDQRVIHNSDAERKVGFEHSIHSQTLDIYCLTFSAMIIDEFNSGGLKSAYRGETNGAVWAISQTSKSGPLIQKGLVDNTEGYKDASKSTTDGFLQTDVDNALIHSKRRMGRFQDSIDGGGQEAALHCDKSDDADSRYWLDRDRVETARLNEQHEYLKRMLGRSVPLPDVLKREIEGLTCPRGQGVDAGSKDEEYAVLDIGAGSLAWTLDIARLFGVDSKKDESLSQQTYSLHCSNLASSLDTSLNKNQKSDTAMPRRHRRHCKRLKLYATDLSDSQFPPVSTLSRYGITTFTHDITQPFPSHYNQKFDVVHARLLVYALSWEGWRMALENVRNILKPGGKLVLVELNARWYHADRPFPDGWRFERNSVDDEKTETFVGDQTWVDRFNSTVDKLIIQRHSFVPDLVYRLPALLASTKYTITSQAPFVTPMGALCRAYPGPRGQDVSDEEERTVRMTLGVYAALMRNALGDERACLAERNSEDGKEWERNERRRQFMCELETGLVEEGALAVWTEIVAQVICT